MVTAMCAMINKRRG